MVEASSSAGGKAEAGSAGTVNPALNGTPKVMPDYPGGSVPLPTLSSLGIADDESKVLHVDPTQVASSWFKSFAQALTSSKSPSQSQELKDLFCSNDSYWRDILALTWDYRTFRGVDSILPFLDDRLKVHEVSNLELDLEHVVSPVPDAKLPKLENPAPGLYWITAFYKFDTKFGKCSGIFRLIPQKDGIWRAFTVFTMLENVHGHEENIYDKRPYSVGHGTWLDSREEECEFKNEEPTVIILGAGQSGLDVAARLKAIGVKSLIIDRNARVGDNWRLRYRFLTLHDPVWFDHMPFLNFPPTWPIYTPAPRLANWLESYAETFELNVWTSSNIVNADFDESADVWNVTIKRGDGSERVLKPRFFVAATGIGSGLPKSPVIPESEKFKGQIMHSSKHKEGKDFAGKSVVVVGSSTSSHDICQDLYQNGVNVTMVQRNPTYIMSVKHGMPVIMGDYKENGPPLDVCDRLGASLPIYVNKGLGQHGTQVIAEKDKELLQNLEKAGFRTNFGIDGSGFAQLGLVRAGGYYLDVGCSQLIIDGKIKHKYGEIDRYSQDGLVFKDGSQLQADAVIYATGFGDMREGLRNFLPEKIMNKLYPVWGLDKEYEMNSAWRFSGQKNLFFFMGNLAMCRRESKNFATQIKALELGLFEEKDRYSLHA